MMRRIRRAALALLALMAPAAAAGPNALEFVALGDMPYTIPTDYEKFDRLISAINRVKPAFS